MQFNLQMLSERRLAPDLSAFSLHLQSVQMDKCRFHYDFTTAYQDLSDVQDSGTSWNIVEHRVLKNDPRIQGG